ncbi:MAG TPA: hypothetical protein VIJ94_07715 [Caulobacteraceae bacterium]
MQEAELDDCVDHPIGVERRDDKVARLIPSCGSALKRGSDALSMKAVIGLR